MCVSRAFGAGGEEIGRLVADSLGLLYVDEQVIARAAAKAGVDVERVADEERRKSIFSGLLDHLAEGGAASFTPVPAWTDELPSEAVRGFIRDAIHEIAEQGNAVIVAHAASFALGPGPRTLRVLVTASQETRSARLSSADGMSQEEAAKAIRRSDADRSDYLKRFYGIAQELPIQYDLVVNTDTISNETAAELITQACVGARSKLDNAGSR